MYAAVDVDYRTTETSIAAAVLFNAWTDAFPVEEHTEQIGKIDDYVPGEFYKRELPPLMRVLARYRHKLSLVIVDGYVWIENPDDTRGLGAHLYDALGARIPVVGVAKTPMQRSGECSSVLRGESETPLFVSAVGVDLAEAAAAVQSMHGRFRIPTLLKRVDRLARDTMGSTLLD